MSSECSATALLNVVQAELNETRLHPRHVELFQRVLGILIQASNPLQKRLKRQQALVWALVLIDHADDLINSTVFNKVNVETRIVYMLASICKAAAHLSQISVTESLDGDAGEPSTISDSVIHACDDGPRQHQTQTHHLRNALQALDKGVLVTGAPVASDQVAMWIHQLQTQIISIAPHPLIIHEPPLYLTSALPVQGRVSQQLSRLSPQCAVKLYLLPPSISKFNEHLGGVSPATPIVIQGAISHWPCFNDRPWRDVAYLLTQIGPDRLVPVEIGSRYTDETWTQKLLPVSDLMQHIIDGERLSDTPISPHTIASNNASAVMYLAQHNLLDQIPSLALDVEVPDYCITAPPRSHRAKLPHLNPTSIRQAPNTHSTLSDTVVEANNDEDDDQEVRVNTWLGPLGTHSPLHTDPHDNLFAQVVGFKYVRMYAPTETLKLYPHAASTLLSNTSQVDVACPDFSQFPDFAHANYVECVVGPRDVLLIPRGWWHYVASLTSSISVSFWF
ncbi:hypothetical protein BASA83_011656 [Batrachochytrium salamandrivorans]|nr:hypothetical protein BASA62_000650 [Batrachochytrium salamandrivorans]KAH9264830.1 hypothetical protein BASA83_011656 [Batrachochytrium salamandrivorans]